jgi:hypothetical protein
MSKNIKISTLLFLLSSSLLTVLFAKQVRADCTRWHPHHCAQERLENTPFDPNTWNPVDWVNSGAGELCETNSIATAQRNTDREQGLDPIQKEYLRPYFGSLVDEVTVKWGSLLNDEWTFQGRTVEAGSAGQTYGNTIYIAEKRQPRSTSQLTLLAHEFRHVQQYRQRGNLDNFCREYMTAYANAQFDYENNSFERDAYEFDYKFASELKNKIPSTYSYNYEYTHSTPSWNRRSAVVLPTVLPTANDLYKNAFMIFSDRNSNLAVNALNGAKHLAPIALHQECRSDNPDCLWIFRDGMLISARDQNLAINALNGARHLGDLALHSGCNSSNPDCTWTYRNGMFVSDRDPNLAINALNGAKHLGELKLHNACESSNPDCTWTKQTWTK